MIKLIKIKIKIRKKIRSIVFLPLFPHLLEQQADLQLHALMALIKLPNFIVLMLFKDTKLHLLRVKHTDFERDSISPLATTSPLTS